MTTVREITALPDRTYKGYIFDLDGTIYLGSQLLPGAREVVLGLRERGARVVFVTNNPTRDPQMYARNLTDLGIATNPADVVNTVVTMTTWLVVQPTGTTAFVMGEEPRRGSLVGAGVPLSEAPDEIDVVVASYDRSFDYRKCRSPSTR